LTSPPAGAEKTFTKSSAFSFFVSDQQIFELLDLAGVNVLRLRQLRQELFGYLLLKCRHIASYFGKSKAQGQPAPAPSGA